MQVDITPMLDQAIAEHSVTNLLDNIASCVDAQTGGGRDHDGRWKRLLAVIEKAAHDCGEIERDKVYPNLKPYFVVVKITEGRGEQFISQSETLTFDKDRAERFPSREAAETARRHRVNEKFTVREVQV